MHDSRILADDVAQQLCDGATLVTANKRLAREIRQQFNQYQLAQGKQVWETADILPFEAWIFRLWQFIQGQSATTPSERMVLNVLQSKAVWTQIIDADIKTNQRDSAPLWNIAATVTTAMEAWRICCQWNIAPDECAKSWLADHRSFARWTDLFIRQCENNNWIDGQQLVEVVIAEWAGTLIAGALTDAALIWMGFDGLNAQQERLIAMLAQNDAHVDIHQFANNDSADCQFQQYENEYQQWLAAAHWIKDKIECDPNQRLAVVVPNLHQSRSAIEYALNQVLNPHHLLDSSSSRAKPFHISLGVKLKDAPVVDAALLLLSLTSTASLSNATISKVILSPFIGGADGECHARNKFEFWCRQYLPYELKFPRFLDLLKQWLQQGQSVPPVFVEKINANSRLMEACKETRLFSAWAEFFLHWLANLGWPGERALNSEQYQTVEAFKREVCVLRSLDRVSKGAVSMATALVVLRQRLNEKPFEAESPTVNVDVLSIVETSGIEFDAIWFANLTERDWPPALQASPFIPHQRQQQAGYQRASVLLNADHARAQQQRLRNQCSEMVCSRYRFDRDVKLLPSAFFKETDEDATAPISLIKHLQMQKPSLETFIGTQGVGVGTQNDSATRGGIAVIRNQAACPFRAYAKHRLGARDSDMRKPGLDAADRGKLIHSVLEGVWQTVQSSQKLVALSDNELQQIIDHNISKCSKRFFHASGSGKAFFRLQAQWIKELMLEWFAVERNRAQAFRVVELEQQQQLTLGKLTLNFKIDRMDELADKTRALIDYKTGMAISPKHWSGERPEEPQLPLYALVYARAHHVNTSEVNTSEHENNHKHNQATLSTLLFGQVRAGECAYVGISQQSFQTVKGKVLVLGDSQRGEDLENLQERIEYWNEQLTKLAEQYYAGHAEVNPLDKTTCRYCDLHGLCRIGSRY